MNTNKTQALLVTKRRTRELPDTAFSLNNTNIEWENTAKYLGVVIDKKLTFRNHIEHVVGKTQNAIKMLYPLINRKSKLSVENKILIFKAALRPIYTYACPIFADIAKTHLMKLQRIQNKILKMILNLPWYTPTQDIHQTNNIEMVNDFIQKLSTNYRCRMESQA